MRTRDFAAVRSVGTDVKTTVRTVLLRGFQRGNLIELKVCADGFLQYGKGNHGYGNLRRA